MRLVSNGIAKDVAVLKHFKIGSEEYVLYKNVNGVSLGLISDNKITMPDGNKLEVLMKVLSNLISPNPVESINIANGCSVLSEIIEGSIEEVSFQNVNIPEATLNSLLSTPVVPTVNTIASTPVASTPEAPEAPKEKIKDNKMKVYGIIIVVLILVLVFVLFKDKLFSGSSSPSPTPEPTPVETPVPQPVGTIDSCPGCVYSFYEDFKHFVGDESTPLTEYVNNYQELIDVDGNPRSMFLGHILDGEGKIQRAFVCGIQGGNPFCLEGFTDGSLYENNRALLINFFGEGMCTEENGYKCNGEISADAYQDGNVKIIKDNYECQVYSTGDLGCQSRAS